MNRGNKIKSFVLLLSWVMIFVHSVIPHNHPGSDPFLSHLSVETGTVTCQHFQSTLDCSEDEESCRISGLLFHKFHDDDQYLNIDLNGYCKPVTIFVRFYNDQSSGFPVADYSGFFSTRAPPQA